MMAKPNQIPNIDFNPELFNNVFWHLKEAFNNLLIRFIWIYGGSSASKSFSVVQLTIIEMLEGSDNNTLVLRKYATDIKDSIYSDFKNTIKEWGLDDLFIIQQNHIKCVTGSFVRFRGLDDSEKVKGITNFKRVILEEISQFDEVDLKQIKKRLRGRPGQQIVGIFNPISEEHWIKVNVFDKENLTEIDTEEEAKQKKINTLNWTITGKWKNDLGNTVILKVNYTDNYWVVGKWRDGKLVGGFVDQHTIDDFERDKINDYPYYLIYALGNWGKLRTGGEFWKDFNSSVHVKSNKNLELYDPSLPISIVWDKNVRPYQPCALWQTKLIKDDKGNVIKKEVSQFYEFAYEDPRNRVRIVCEDFKDKFPVEMVKGLFVFGDRTAVAEDSTKEKGQNFYTEILNYLKDYKPTLKMQGVNPSVAQSAKFVNAIYRENEADIVISIGDNCKKSIYDYQYALEDAEGGISKKTKQDPITKISYQEFGHFSDMKRYLLTVTFANEYSNYIVGKRGRTISMGKTTRKSGY